MPSRSKQKRAKRDAAKQLSVHSGQGHGQRTRIVSAVANARPTYEQRIAAKTSRQMTAANLMPFLRWLRASRGPPGSVEVKIEGEDAP